MNDLFEKYLPNLIQFVVVDAKIAIGKNQMFYVTNIIQIIDNLLLVLRKTQHVPVIKGENAPDVDPLDHSLYFLTFADSSNDTFSYFSEESRKSKFYGESSLLPWFGHLEQCYKMIHALILINS